MQNDSNLVGVWKTQSDFYYIPQSETTLVFKSDGTGWLKVSNAYTWAINFFQWAPTSSGWVVLTGTKRLEPHVYTQKAIEVQPIFEVEHLPYKINHSLGQLQIDWPIANNRYLNLSENLFDLVSHDADS